MALNLWGCVAPVLILLITGTWNVFPFVSSVSFEVLQFSSCRSFPALVTFVSEYLLGLGTSVMGIVLFLSFSRYFTSPV